MHLKFGFDLAQYKGIKRYPIRKKRFMLRLEQKKSIGKQAAGKKGS